jgi:nitrous oxide reductase
MTTDTEADRPSRRGFLKQAAVAPAAAALLGGALLGGALPGTAAAATAPADGGAWPSGVPVHDRFGWLPC